MLSIQKQPKYIEKEIRLPNGSWAVVVFELIEVNGKIIAKAVGGRFINKATPLGKDVVFAIAGCCEVNNVEPVVSPFFSEIKELIKDLSFVVSQPARAPNFN